MDKLKKVIFCLPLLAIITANNCDASLIKAASSGGDNKFYGKSDVKINPSLTSLGRFRLKSATSQLPPGLVFEAAIPETSATLVCHLINNRRLFQIRVFFGMKDNNNTETAAKNIDNQQCHYHGWGFIRLADNHQLATKCLVSFCDQIRHGYILVGNSETLQFELDETLSTAKFVSTFQFQKLELLKSSITASPRKGDHRNWNQILSNAESFPKEWRHLKIAVLVTVESFTSNFLKSDTNRTIQFVSGAFGLINAIWSHFKVAVYLTNILIWKNYTDPVVAPMPVSDWFNIGNIFANLPTFAENSLWQTIDETADYIVVLRNMDRDPPKDGESLTIGLTMLSSMCRGKFAPLPANGAILAVSTLRHADDVGVMKEFAATTAHELGHAFGIHHDNETQDGQYCQCEDDGDNCVMTKHGNQEKLQWSWSNCSDNFFELYADRLPRYCLTTVPTTTAAQVCGNGVVEPGEDCDCGPAHLPFNYSKIFCENPACCNAETCRLTPGSNCSYGECCNTTSCSHLGPETMCRQAKTGGCDLPEFCVGDSSECSDDVYMMTGTVCGRLNSRDGSCYQGECITRADDCLKLLHVPPVGEDIADSCYSANMKGGNATNCGHTRFLSNDQTYFKPCSENDKECGSLMCSGKEQPAPDISDLFKPQPNNLVSLYSFLAEMFFFYGKTARYNEFAVCRSVASPVFPDYGLVRDGASCAKGRGYCLKQACVTPLPTCNLPPCDNKGNHISADPAYIGMSPVTFKRAGINTSNDGLVLVTQIPNTTISFTCQLIANNQVPMVDIYDEATTYDGQLCNYNGVASFSTSPLDQTKCLISLCDGIQHGVVWLPRSGKNDGDSWLHFDLSNDLTTAAFVASSTIKTAEQKLRQRKIGEATNISDQQSWVNQIVDHAYPPDWLHLRIAVLISAEAFTSVLFDRNRTMALNFVSSSFGLLNAIWYPLKVAVHLTRVIIWPQFDEAKTEELGNHEWLLDVEERILSPLTTLAENKLWPQIGQTADYIVVARNMLDFAWPTQRVGVSTPDSVCNGMSRKTGSAILAVACKMKQTRQQILMELTLAIAYQLGRAFGMKDDYDPDSSNCTCSSGTLCIMNPLNEFFSIDKRNSDFGWSTCSRDSFQKYRAKLPPPCLETVPVWNRINNNTVVPVCGNGVVENGEDCDCGPDFSLVSPIYCPNPKCCNRQTCRLADNAKCVSGPCCDLTRCQFKPGNKAAVCRESRSIYCDPSEFCNGTSSACPPNVYMKTGEPCEVTGTGSCYQGNCLPGRSAMCQNLLGIPLEAATACYLLNMEADHASNCGHGFFRSDTKMTKITPCREQDVECGNLMCSGNYSVNDTIVDGRFLYEITEENVTDDKNQGLLTSCSSIASPILPDYGHVPDGSLCSGKKGYCYKQHCLPLLPCHDEWPCDQNGKHIPDWNPPKPQPYTGGGCATGINKLLKTRHFCHQLACCFFILMMTMNLCCYSSYVDYTTHHN